MEKINAVITGVGGYVPDYVLTNDELSRMVDTTDEWIMTRIGVKERRILNEEGLGTSYMARKAAKQLMQKTGVNPDEIDAVIVCTTTPDYHFPSTASILCDKLGLNKYYKVLYKLIYYERVVSSQVRHDGVAKLPLPIIAVINQAQNLADLIELESMWTVRLKSAKGNNKDNGTKGIDIIKRFVLEDKEKER